MRIDTSGNELRQVSIWLPVAVIRLIRAARLNLTRFLLDQLEIADGGGTCREDLDQRNRLAEAARESFGRQRALEAASEADLERTRDVVHRMRSDRDAAKIRQDGIADALVQVIGNGSMSRYRRIMPENDPDGDRLDEWETLVRRVSRLCGAEIDSAEVAAGLRALVAARP